MNRKRILDALAERRQEIVARFGVKRLALFSSAVELVTDKALREELRPHIEKELIRVA